MMKNTKHILLLLLPLLYASCIMEESITPVEQKPQDIQIDLKVADTRLPNTRAISASSENSIKDLYMVIYDADGKYKTYKKASKIEDTGTNGTTKRATFSVGSATELADFENVCLRFFANMNDNVSGFETTVADQTVGTSDMYEFTSLTYGITSAVWNTTSDTNFRPIPMWGGLVDALGNRNDAVVTLVEGENTGIQAELMRATARINVKLKDESTLKINSIDLYHIQQTGYVNVPVDKLNGAKYDAAEPYEGTGTGALGESTLSTTPLSYSLSTPAYSYTNSIYVPETKNYGNATSGDSITMVVGITDGTNTRYSRVDFVDENKNLLNLVRNHTYEITLAFNPKTQLTGYSTKALALAYRTENLTYDFDVINDKYLNVMVTDGKYLLTLSQDDFTVPLAGGTVDFVVCTPPYMDTGKCTGWYINPEEIKVNGTAVGSGGDSGIKICKKDDPTVETWSGKENYNYYLMINVPEQSAPTEYVMYLRCTDKFYWELKVHQHN